MTLGTSCIEQDPSVPERHQPVVLMCPRFLQRDPVLWEIWLHTAANVGTDLDSELWADLVFFLFGKVLLRSDGYGLMKLQHF